MSYPAEGTMAPDFTLDTDAGTPLTLSALRGRPVVLFFYPKDDTPGCTIESCEFRDMLPRFQGVDAQILGISPDDVKSHVKFRKKFDLPYPLLADVGHPVAELYGVWQEKSMMGRKYMGNARTTFVIDREGRIAKVFEKVSPLGHAAEVAEVVAKLG
jgi:thioredoxin-dependent peroxiredoxin